MSALDELDQALSGELRRHAAASQPQGPAAPAAAPARPVTGNAWAVGVALLAFGIPGWLAGGKYTIVGWIEWANTFFRWLGLPVNIPQPVGWWLLLALPVAFLYSRVEVNHRPARRVSGRLLARPAHFWIAWLLVVATDIGSTYQGVRVPATDAWLVTQQIAASAYFSFVWAVLLTFTPEWLILGGMRLLRQ